MNEVMTCGPRVKVRVHNEYPGFVLLDLVNQARMMLEVLLRSAGIQIGEFRFLITGVCEALVHQTMPTMILDRPESLNHALSVRLKTSVKTIAGTALGMAFLPDGTDTESCFEKLQLALQFYNKTNWSGVLRLAPTEMVYNPVRRAIVVREEALTNAEMASPVWQVPKTVAKNEGSGLRARRNHFSLDVSNPHHEGRISLLAPQPLRRSITRNSNPVTESPAIPRRERPSPVSSTQSDTPAEGTSMDMSPEEKRAKLIRFVRLVSQGANHGVFSGHGILQHSRELFPNERIGFLRSGILFELVRLGWIRRVPGSGQYQVEVAFNEEYQLGLTIKPLPSVSLHRTRPHKRSAGAAGGNGYDVSGPDGIDLDATLRGMGEAIAAHQRVLAQRVSEAETRRNAAKQVLDAAEEALKKAEEAARRFNADIKTRLGETIFRDPILQAVLGSGTVAAPEPVRLEVPTPA